MKKLSYVLFALATTACSVNGKPLFGFGSTTPTSSPSTAPTATAASPSSVNVTNPVVKSPAPATYAWCKDVPDDNQWNDVEDIFSGTVDVDRVLPTIATVLCHPDSDASHPSRTKRDQIEAARQAWLAKLGMTEAEWATDYMEWHAIPFAHRNASHVPWPQPKLAWSTMGPIDQHSYILQDTGLAGPFTLNGLVAKAYVADAMPLTEAGRLAYIDVCLGETNPVVWATCQADIEAFDRAKYVTEIRSDKSRSGADRTWLRFQLAHLDEALAAHAKRVKEVSARDPAFAKLFEIGKATHAQWKERPRGELLSLVAALDDARETGSKKAMSGCGPKALAQLEKALGVLPASTFDGVQSDPNNGKSFTANALGLFISSPEIYLAANALVACGVPNHYLVEQLGKALPSWPGFRGPRTATLTTILLANLELDARGESLEVPQATLPIAIERASSWSPVRSVSGTPSKIETRGDEVTLVFPKTSEVQQHCTGWRETNRINMIGSDGRIHYRMVCLGTKPVRVDTTIPPVTIAKRYAAGVAAGRFVSTIGNVVEAVWAKPNAKRPIAVYGVVLK